MTESNRATREQEQYDVGLDRDRYESVLSYSDYFYRQRREEILRVEMEYASSRVALELGSVAWSALIEPHNIRPAELHCINISQAELEKGIELAETSVTKPKFSIMDANHLEYEDKFFDVVFGFGILHHLDYTRALDEILRVLKSDGKMIFFEPLDNNPIGKIVRFLTPHARTVDEKPLKFYELREFKKRFEHKEYYEGFLSVPFGVISKFLFRSPDNIMTRFGYKADLWVDRHFPFVRPFYRHIVIVGQPKV